MVNCAILFCLRLRYHLGWGLQRSQPIICQMRLWGVFVWVHLSLMRIPKVSMVNSSLMRIHGSHLTIVCSCLSNRESIKTVDMTAAWTMVPCEWSIIMWASVACAIKRLKSNLLRNKKSKAILMVDLSLWNQMEYRSWKNVECSSHLWVNCRV